MKPGATGRPARSRHRYICAGDVPGLLSSTSAVSADTDRGGARQISGALKAALDDLIARDRAMYAALELRQVVAELAAEQANSPQKRFLEQIQREDELDQAGLNDLVLAGYVAQFEETGNPVFAWFAYRLARLSSVPVPESVLAYIQDAADKICQMTENQPADLPNAIARAFKFRKTTPGQGNPFSKFHKTHLDVLQLGLAVADEIALWSGKKVEACKALAVRMGLDDWQKLYSRYRELMGRRENTADLPSEDLFLPEWKAKVKIRALTAYERFVLKEAVDRGESLMIRLAAASLCDAEGKRLFSDAQASELWNASARAVRQVCDVALRLNSAVRP